MITTLSVLAIVCLLSLAFILVIPYFAATKAIVQFLPQDIQEAAKVHSDPPVGKRVIGYLLILDCWLPPKVKRFIKGAEHCKAWERWEWLKTLAIPEHGLLWTLIVCPIAGLAVAGLNMLL